MTITKKNYTKNSFKLIKNNSMKINYHLSDLWQSFFEEETKKEYFIDIKKQLAIDINLWKKIFPSFDDIFNAYSKTPFENIKVVILWQDPYHGQWQANGLSFSVKKWVKIPPSLRNIYKELKDDLNIDNGENGDLTKWTWEWVMLLNATLSVIEKTPNSHSKIWWQTFTDNTIKYISDNKSWVVFILWWDFAIKKSVLIDKNKHFIISSPHPSPFSAHRWFFWSKVFSKTNEILKKIWQKEINWKLD